jgi:hypothetical protein
MKNSQLTTSSDAPWFEKFQRLIASRRPDAALRLLNDVIENDLPLFDIDRQITADRRIAWLCRIDLLREAGRLTEALAWACLECELHPDNVAAETVKEELKRLTRFGGRSSVPGAPERSGRVVRWSGLAGMRQLRAELESGVIAPLLDPDLYRRYKVPLPNGILLHGPPGCGKTFIARKLAEIIGFRFFEMGPSDLASIYVHGGQKLIRALFEKAADAAPAMIFFDEFDALVPARDGSVGHHYEAEVNELLTQLNECGERQILVVAATNRAEKIDPAVLRPGRFDRHFYVGPPDFEARVELFRLYLAERPCVGINYLSVADKSQNYTSAEIREVVNESARAALVAREPIGQQHLLNALRTRPPALNPEDVARRRIGFGG